LFADASELLIDCVLDPLLGKQLLFGE
jgi:hypothetical protein